MSGFSINTTTVDGNLTADPDLRHTNSGTAICALRIAHNERVKVDDEWTNRPNYFDVTVWGGFGAAIAKQLTKGDRVIVSGRLRWREYEVDGAKRQAIDINADSVIPVPRNGAPAPADTPDARGEDIPF